jgi:Ca2+-binding EF-hand superfamily protein
MADTWKQALEKLKELGGGDLAKVFDVLDADGGGTIDHSELLAALAKVGMALDAAAASAMLKFVDTDGDGTIDRAEWAVLITKC